VFVNGALEVTDPAVFYAAGDTWIERVESSVFGGRDDGDDFTLNFRPYVEVRGRFSHMSSLDPALAAQVGEYGDCKT
jgi:hypothetical protein